MQDKNRVLTLAFGILSRKALSESALKERLLKKGAGVKVVREVIRELKEIHLVADKALAENLVETRVKNRLWGDARITQDLIRKGLSKEDARDAVKKMARDEDAPTEESRAFQLLKKRAFQTKSKDTNDFKRKLFGFLARRGFDPETIESALERYGRET